jgi:hypothetical protein
MTSVISLALLRAMEVDPDPLTIPPCPIPLERLDAHVPPTPPQCMWTLLATLLRRVADSKASRPPVTI